MNSNEHFATLTDDELLERCEKSGLQTRLWRQRFLGLLPEVARRKLYFKKGFSSITEFACTLAGVSQQQVHEVLDLERKLKETPALHQLLIEGRVSHHKLVRVASIAKKENEEFLSSQVKLLSKRGIDALVRDIKYDLATKTEIQQESSHNIQLLDVQKATFNNEIETKQTLEIDQPQLIIETDSNGSAVKIGSMPNLQDFIHLNLTSDTVTKLKNLRAKGFDLNELITELLELREKNIAEEKQKISRQQRKKESERKEEGRSPARSIPQNIKKLLKKEYGTKCAKEGCNKPAEHIHHTRRQALDPSHDPNYLAPLCKEHHEIAHAIDLNVQKNKWKILTS